jgi:hypothetical protein
MRRIHRFRGRRHDEQALQNSATPSLQHVSRSRADVAQPQPVHDNLTSNFQTCSIAWERDPILDRPAISLLTYLERGIRRMRSRRS